MKVSALLHIMDNNDEICIEEFGKPINDMLLYERRVRGISRDSPINRMHMSCLCATNNTVYIVTEQLKERKLINERSKID